MNHITNTSTINGDLRKSNYDSYFAVIIPAYNEEATIHDIAKRALNVSSLVIIIDDGSTDETIIKVENLPVVLIKNGINLGKAASLWKGIQAARQHNVRYIISLDGDGQHAPEDIPKLLAKAEAKPEHIIIGARLADKSVFQRNAIMPTRLQTSGWPGRPATLYLIVNPVFVFTLVCYSMI